MFEQLLPNKNKIATVWRDTYYAKFGFKIWNLNVALIKWGMPVYESSDGHTRSDIRAPQLHAKEKGSRAHVPHARETDHSAHIPMREWEQCACLNTRERGSTARMHMCWAGCMLHLGDHAWWCRGAWCSACLPTSQRVGRSTYCNILKQGETIQTYGCNICV
jgi:hypothetical protein